MVANIGNTGFTLGEGYVVALLQDVFWCRKIREAVYNPRFDKADLTVDDVATVAVHELRDAFREEPPLRVYFGSHRIQPGAVQETVMTFRVPAQLRPNRRYRGTVRVFNSTLSLEFYHAKAEIEAPSGEPSPSAAKGAAKKAVTRKTAAKKAVGKKKAVRKPSTTGKGPEAV